MLFSDTTHWSSKKVKEILEEYGYIDKQVDEQPIFRRKVNGVWRGGGFKKIGEILRGETNGFRKVNE